MATITKEYLDKKFVGIDKRFENIDKKFESIDKKFVDLKSHVDTRFDQQNKDLKEHVTREVEKLALMTAKGFDDLQDRLDFKEEIEKLKRDNKMIKQALNLPL